MALLKPFSTFGELYQFLTEDHGVKNPKQFIFHKVDGKFTGITYLEFKEMTDAFALGLHKLGYNRNEKISILAENRPEWLVADMAIQVLGGTDVPLYPSLTFQTIEFILNNSESKGIVVSNKLQLNKVLKVWENCKGLKFIIVMNEKDVPEGVNNVYSFSYVQKLGREIADEKKGFLNEQISLTKKDDLCTIIYTSGTTGEPKGVMLTHWNIASNVVAALEAFPIFYTDTFLSFLPLCHIFERMTGYYTGFASGGNIYFAESIETVAQNLIEVKPTLMTSVPRLFERIYSKIIKNVEMQPEKKRKIFYWALETGKLYAQYKKEGKIPFTLKAKHRLADKLVLSKIREKTGGNLRFFVSGGAALPKELGEFFEAIGIIIIEGYGLTESSPVISANRLDDYKFGTVGKSFTGVEVKIALDGEILARGPNIMQGYYKNKKETDEVLKDGWLHTGDIGEFDKEGFLRITDRKKHLFKTSGGKYIAPTPIENLFLQSKYIEQFVLIGEGKTFLSGLIVPDFDSLKQYADENKISYQQVEDLTKTKEIYSLMDKELAKLQKGQANYERVRKFVILDKPFSIETGEITPTMKVKRKIVEERYSNLINEMYSGMV